MNVALVYPPTVDPTAPYLAVPMLTGFLRSQGVAVLPIDANVEAYDRLLQPGPLAALNERLEQRLDRLERKSALDHQGQLAYLALWRARGDGRAVPEGISRARSILRDPVAFFDPEAYGGAVATIEAATRLISAAHAPLELSFSGYRTPFALTTPEEIAYDADPERDPFDGYVRNVLVPRLRASGSRVVGVSVCFPGQLQPAYAFGLKIKELMPEAHLTVGGPGMTQLLVRLSGQDLKRALGPFDSAVLFEGEHALLRLIEAVDAGRPLRGLPQIVHRDPLLGARYEPGEGAEDMRELPAPDFDGLPLDLYLSPALSLPYDPTRGCYWGKCTFCHYGLAEVGTASYRERRVESVVEHLRALRDRYNTRWFYLSQDSVAPKTLVKLSQALADADLGLRWATDLKPENYLNSERAKVLKRGGAVACALGVESGAPRVLEMIDKGAPITTVKNVMGHLTDAGIAVEAMCFTDFPTESYDEAMQTLSFLEDNREHVSLYIVGEFDLTHGAVVAQEPARFGLKETWQLDGDLLGTGLFYEEAVPSKRDDEQANIDRALDDLSSGWLVRRYPWAGSLSTAHTVLYYDRFGAQAFRDLAARQRLAVPFGARPSEALARFDLEELAAADLREREIWRVLVRERRHVSRAAYRVMAAALPLVRQRPRRYRFAAGEMPVVQPRAAIGRRPPNASNAAG